MIFRRWIVSLLATGIVAGCMTASADDFSGEKTLGVRTGYNTRNREPLAGIEFTYRFNRLLRLAPSAEYVFRRDGRDALMLNLNSQFVFPLAGGRCNLFPLAGINYSSWNYHPSATGNYTDDVSSRVSRFGLNAGAGVDTNLTGSLRLSLSGQYTFIKSFGGVNICAGIHYRF